MEILLFAAGTFVLGSIPFGRILGFLVAHTDVKERGSGNIGATNVAREIGLRWGLLTLGLDIAKGAGPVVAAGALMGSTPYVQEMSGLAAVAGHQFSVFLRFRGGKGVATALGAFSVLEPFGCLCVVIVFVAVAGVSSFVSLGSIVASASLPFCLALLGAPPARTIAAAAVGLLIIWRHKENIQRLLKGEESRVRKK